MEGYAYHSLCKVCNARDVNGKSLREEIDAMIAQGKRNVDCIKFLVQHGIKVTERNFSRHLTKHSPFATSARRTRSDKAIRLKHEADLELKEAHETLQKIINLGSHMIDNWWSEVEGVPKLPVSERLFIEALKEEGRRAPRTELDIELDQMEKDFIEGNRSD